MNPKANQYIKDLHSYIEQIPFGDVEINIKRAKKATVEVTTIAEETVKYHDSKQAEEDLNILLTNLIQSGFSGDAHIKLAMKDGQIQIISVFNKKQIKY